MPGTITTKHTLWDAYFTVNGTDLTNRIESATFFEVGTNAHDGASMGELQDYSIPGTKTITDPVITFFQDFTASKSYATCYALWNAQTIFDLIGKASSAATDVTNPQWTIPVFVSKQPILSGSRKDRHMAPTTFKVAGIITRTTA